MDIAKAFLDKVKTVGADVFSDEGLPTLKIKDEIREAKMQLRNFENKLDENAQNA